MASLQSYHISSSVGEMTEISAIRNFVETAIVNAYSSTNPTMCQDANPNAKMTNSSSDQTAD